MQIYPMCLTWLNFLELTGTQMVNKSCWWSFINTLSMCMPFLREGNGTPLQYSCLENPMDGGAWWAVVHGVAGSQTWLSDFTFTSHFSLSCIGEEMATHSSVLAWRIPGTGKPGGLPSMGSHRVGHDWSDLAAAAAAAERKHWILANLSYSHPINGKK